MTQLMGVNVTETGFEGTAVHHLAKPGVAQSAALAQPQPRFVGPVVLPADAEVAVKGGGPSRGRSPLGVLGRDR